MKQLLDFVTDFMIAAMAFSAGVMGLAATSVVVRTIFKRNEDRDE